MTFSASSSDLNVTEEDLVEAHELATKWTLEDVRPLMKKVLIIHEHDPNFPLSIIDRIKAFLSKLYISSRIEHTAFGRTNMSLR